MDVSAFRWGRYTMTHWYGTACPTWTKSGGRSRKTTCTFQPSTFSGSVCITYSMTTQRSQGSMCPSTSTTANVTVMDCNKPNQSNQSDFIFHTLWSVTGSLAMGYPVCMLSSSKRWSLNWPTLEKSMCTAKLRVKSTLSTLVILSTVFQSNYDSVLIGILCKNLQNGLILRNVMRKIVFFIRLYSENHKVYMHHKCNVGLTSWEIELFPWDYFRKCSLCSNVLMSLKF